MLYRCAGDASEGSVDRPLDVGQGRLRKFAAWLGHWKPEYDVITRDEELVLHVSCYTPCNLCVKHHRATREALSECGVMPVNMISVCYI